MPAPRALCSLALAMALAAAPSCLEAAGGSAARSAARQLLLAGAARRAAPRAPRRSSQLGMRANASAARFTPPYVVCTSDWAPIVTCSPDEDPGSFGGYQVELWRRIATDMGWNDSHWTFACMDWTAMLDDLVDPAGRCSLAAAGVEVSLENLLAGIKFSWPIMRSGLQVLIASGVEEGGVWAFAEAFQWPVWLALAGTAVSVSLLVTAAEVLAHGSAANRMGLRGWSWSMSAKMVQVPTHVGDPKTWGSRLLVLGYAFLTVIMVHLFTATTASKLTMQRLASDITGRSDLPGKSVMTWEPYVPLLRKHSIDADPMPWESDADMDAMLSNLRSHRHLALVLDAPVVVQLAALAPGCDLFAVGEAFETFNLALAFPPNAPDALAAGVSESIVRLQTTQALLDRLENELVKSAQSTKSRGHSDGARSKEHAAACSAAHAAAAETGGHGSQPQIMLRQVAGLWYILAIATGAAGALAVVQHAWPLFAGRCAHDPRLRGAAAAANPQHQGDSSGGSSSDCGGGQSQVGAHVLVGLASESQGKAGAQPARDADPEPPQGQQQLQTEQQEQQQQRRGSMVMQPPLPALVRASPRGELALASLPGQLG